MIAEIQQDFSSEQCSIMTKAQLAIPLYGHKCAKLQALNASYLICSNLPTASQMQKQNELHERIQTTLKNAALLLEPIKELIRGVETNTIPWHLCA